MNAAPLPPHLAARILGAEATPDGGVVGRIRARDIPAERYGDGERTDAIVRYVGRMLKLGHTVDETRELALALNARACVPPLAEQKVADTVASMAKTHGRRNGGAASRTPPIVDLVRVSDVEREDVQWEAPGVIARGKLHALQGDPGFGKTTLALAIAAAITRGGTIMGSSVTSPGDVILVTYEDGIADTIRPRAEAAGVDLTRLHALRGVRATETDDDRSVALPRDANAIEEAVRRTGARLVIIDPLTAALGGEIDAYRDTDTRRALAPLARIAEETGAAFLLLRHLTKAGHGRALLAGGGSIGVAAACRVVHHLAADPDRPDDPSARVLAMVKNNLAPLAPTRRFRLVDAGGVARIEWGDTSPRTADDLVGLRAAEQGNDAAEGREADAWLREVLADGAATRKDLEVQAREAGFPFRTIQRAADRLNVARRVEGFGRDKRSTWALPAAPEPAQLGHESSIRANCAVQTGAAQMGTNGTNAASRLIRALEGLRQSTPAEAPLFRSIVAAAPLGALERRDANALADRLEAGEDIGHDGLKLAQRLQR